MISDLVLFKDFYCLLLIPVERPLFRTFDEDYHYLLAKCCSDPFNSICSNTFLGDHLHEFVVFYHLHHDLCPTNKFAVNVELREAWPCSIELEPIC